MDEKIRLQMNTMMYMEGSELTADSMIAMLVKKFKMKKETVTPIYWQWRKEFMNKPVHEWSLLTKKASNFDYSNRRKGGRYSNIQIDKDELYEMYVTRNYNTKQLREHFDASDKVIYRYLAKYDIPLKTKKIGNSEELKQSILEMYLKKGMSMVAISKEMGCSHKTITNRLISYGVLSGIPSGSGKGKRNASISQSL